MGEEHAETILTSMEKGVSSLFDALKMGPTTDQSPKNNTKRVSTPLLSSNFGF